MTNPPKIFISYSHDTNAHKTWVKEIATFLRENGVDTILDQWDLSLGSDLTKFMEHGLSQSDRVLIVLTDNYIEKANAGQGGVGYEKMIATAAILTEQNTTKFIPVVRDVSGKDKLPVFLGARLYIDLSDKNDTEDQRIELLKELHKAHETKPAIGANPFSKNEKTKGKEVLEHNIKPTKPELRDTESTAFFADRFASAFPGVRGIEWFESQKSIGMRLGKLLESPLDFKDGSPVWWWRDGNLHIHSFRGLGNGLYLMDWNEYRITKIAAVNMGDYYQKFVYVETEAMEPTGLYPAPEERIEYWIKQYGYCSEEYGLYKGETKVTRAEYDDNAALINGVLVELGGDVELRVRYITPYNFVIAANGSPINNNSFDRKLRDLLNSMLTNNGTIEDLSQAVMRLQKKERYRI